MDKQANLPLYQSHKGVRAAKIAGILKNADTNIDRRLLVFAGPNSPDPITVSEDYIAKHQPSEGGYYVLYQDGYESWSPAEAFEGGYERLLDTHGLVDAKRIRRAAAVAHEINRAYCEALGDFSQPSWLKAPAWQVRSAIQGVDFHLENPDADASASHRNWMKKKTDEGWAYGKKKDPETKTHPCLLPFSQLPKEQQVKDFLFKAVVHALLLDALDETRAQNTTVI